MPEYAPTPRQELAQRLANNLIQNHSTRTVIQEAISFIAEHVACELVPDGDYVRIALEADSLSAFNIPSGYGVKGGAARELLVSALGLRARRAPRDIDIVRRGTHATSDDEHVARLLMPRDFQHGGRVELIRTIPRYLGSRDITLNEVVVIDDTLSASLLGVLDTIGGVIRPSRYRGGTLHRRPRLIGQSLLKMVRLYAEGVCAGESWSLVGIPEEASFSEFDLAVHMNKAFQQGRAVVERFLHTCALLSLIAASTNPVRDILEDLEHLRHGEQGLFPDVPENEWAFLLEELRQSE